MSELMTREEVADYLALHPNTISKFVVKGDLPATELPNAHGGVAFVFELEDVVAFIEACRIVPGTVLAGRPLDDSIASPRLCLYCGRPLFHNKGRCEHPEAVTGRHEPELDNE